MLVVAHLQRRSSQRAALHADQLHTFHAFLRTHTSWWILLSVQIVVLRVAPVDDADPVVPSRPLFPRLLARPELAAHLGVGRRAGSDRRRRYADRPSGREDLTPQIPHTENLTALHLRVLAHRRGVVMTCRRLRPQILQILQIVICALRDRQRDALRLRLVIARRIAVHHVLIVTSPVVVVRADTVYRIYA